MPPITTIIPTQQELLQMYQDPNTLLNQFTAAHTPKPAMGSPAAVTAAGTPGFPGTAGSNLNNLNNPDWITSMSEMINQINLKAQQEANAARIPGAAGLEKTSSANIGRELGGQVPDDVFRELQQRGAEQGVFTGSPAGANTTAGIMQALGLTSLDMTNLGQKHLTEAYGRNPGAPLSNPQALVTTPAQAEALRLQQQNMELDYLARMAAINAARDRTRSGYGGGGGGYPRSGGGGGGFAPATNWQGGTPTPLTQPWHLPYSIGNYPGSLDTVLPGMDLGGSNDTVQPGMDFTDLGFGGGWGALYDQNPVSYNPALYPGGGGIYPSGGAINPEGLSEDELDWLYNVGG